MNQHNSPGLARHHVHRRRAPEGRALAMALIRSRTARRAACPPFKAGVIAVIVILARHVLRVHALQPVRPAVQAEGRPSSRPTTSSRASPVRIAGVDVGKVKKVEPTRPARRRRSVTMEIQKQGLPIHEDAQLKIRPRIFLEGNFFVDIQPGTPSAPNLRSPATPSRSSRPPTPVQFGERAHGAPVRHARGPADAPPRVLGEGPRQRRRGGLQPRPRRRAGGLRNVAHRQRGHARPAARTTSRTLLRGQQRLCARR